MESNNIEEKPTQAVSTKGMARIRSVLNHISLLGTLVLYTTLGGLIFRALERPEEITRVEESQYLIYSERVRFIEYIVNNSADVRNLATVLHVELNAYENALYEAAKNGITSIPMDYPGYRNREFAERSARWNYLESIFFASTILTSIGYGNMPPVTFNGRFFCIVYALVGIPLTLTVIADLGKIMATAVSTINNNLRGHFGMNWIPLNGVGQTNVMYRFLQPISALFAVILLLLYISAGAALFMLWEDWTFFEGFYFCFITMTTIGFGDLVPGDPEYMLICTLYILVGLALTSTIIELVRRRYAQSWKRMKELSARLQLLSGPLSEALRKLDIKSSEIDSDVLQELRDLKKTLALTRIETRLRFNTSIGIKHESAIWAQEVLKEIEDIVEEPPKKDALKVVVYESSV